MKIRKVVKISLLTSLLFGTVLLGGIEGKASATSFGGSGNLGVTDSGTSTPVDPEKPGEEVDPGPGPSTDGPLRIDFISALNFGNAQITPTNRTFNSLAQLFHSDTAARGFYVQVSDYRSDEAGWSLTLSQETQFRSAIVQDLESQTLDGAVLSFDKGWANSFGSSGTPTVSRDTMAINEMNTSYTVASAGSGEGKGVWTIAFGASSENEQGLENTLTPLTDAEGNPVMDTAYNKQAYSNSAVSITIPDSAKIYPVQYTTTLKWTLEAGPT